jgi:hypothetical protein
MLYHLVLQELTPFARPVAGWYSHSLARCLHLIAFPGYFDRRGDNAILHYQHMVWVNRFLGLLSLLLRNLLSVLALCSLHPRTFSTLYFVVVVHDLVINMLYVVFIYTVYTEIHGCPKCLIWN